MDNCKQVLSRSLSCKDEFFQEEITEAKEIVFIDSAVPDLETLRRGVLPRREVYLLSSEEDAIAQITSVLQNRTDVRAVHIVSHGSAGCLHFGQQRLDAETIERYRAQLTTWFSTSVEEGSAVPDLLLYGCQVAAGEVGDTLLRKLRQWTGANIAASDTPTGAAALDGDWKLEKRIGNVQTNIPLSVEAQAEFSGVLTQPKLTSIIRQTPTDTVADADTLTFRVTFDEEVQNVDATDFVVTGTTASVVSVKQADAYKFYRFITTKARSSNVGVQLSEFDFYFNGIAQNPVNVTNPEGSFKSSETPPNLIDNRTSTKWYSNIGGALIFEFGSSIQIDGYSFATANDVIARDPISWRIEGSEDGSTWNLVDTQANFATPTARGTHISPVSTSSAVPFTYDVTIQGGDLASINGIVGLDLAANPTIQDLDGNALLADKPSTDETYSLRNNDAPISNGNASLDPQREDTTTPGGEDVASLFRTLFSDADSDTLSGVAIVGNAATAAEGVWQYSTNGGLSWNDLGNVSTSAAFTLAANDNLQFRPAADFNGAVGPLSVHLVDSSASFTSGTTVDLSGIGATGGSTQYSAATSDINLTITPDNDAPVNTVPGAQTVTEEVVTAIAGISVTDVDGNLATTQLTVNNGTLNVTLSGSATISAGTNSSTDLTISGSETDVNATLASLTYQSNADFSGSDTLTVRSADSEGVPLTDTDTVAITVDLDTDGDTVADRIDLDDDNDGILDSQEETLAYESFDAENPYDSAPVYRPGVSQNGRFLTGIQAISQDALGRGGKFLFHGTGIGTYRRGDEIWGTPSTIAVEANTDYTFEFYVANVNNINPEQLDAYINNVKVGGTFKSTQKGVWVRHQVT